MKQGICIAFLLITLSVFCSFDTTTTRLQKGVTAQDSLKGIDPETGLVIAKDLILVKAHCTGCHSSKMITQFRATKEGWLDRIRWMQKTQKLWDLGEAEPAILAYLSTYYAPVKSPQRREPLQNIQWYKLD